MIFQLLSKQTMHHCWHYSLTQQQMNSQQLYEASHVQSKEQNMYPKT